MFEKVGELLRDFGQSLRFDIQQSANLYVLPIKALTAAYRQGVEQVSHVQPNASKIYDAAELLMQQEQTQKVSVILGIGLGQYCGPSIQEHLNFDNPMIVSPAILSEFGRVSQQLPGDRLAA
jgi:hypothetical protein